MLQTHQTIPMPPNGDAFLESLRDGREVWIYGERVKDVTTHPAFRNSGRSLARLYDAMHDPVLGRRILVPTDTGNGGMTHAFFKNPHTKDDLRAGREAILAWQELVFGWMGRTPDYKASLLTKLGAHPEFFGEYADNARAWYRKAQEGVLHMAHAIVNPPVDRHRPFDEVNDVYVHVEKETDKGLIVSGAKVVATGAPHTQYLFVSHLGAPTTKKEFSLAFIVPTNTPGTKLLCRGSYEYNAAVATSPFDYPLSSRLDENDAILIFDKALIPWENVIVYDVDTINKFESSTGWEARAILQASTRMSVKMDFLAGALSKALDITGAGKFRGVEAALGEVINWRNLVTGIRDGMIENAKPGFGGSMLPCKEYGLAYAAMAPKLYSRIRELVETVVASGLIYLNSNAVDLKTPEIRPYLERYLRGSNGLTVDDRSKTMKLLWDAIGSEFGARHELYELNYFGAPELLHLGVLQGARSGGELDRMRSLVETCMNQYDVNGWTAQDFISPTDVTTIRSR
ncbi:Pyoverdin chromophore biosynthetic protein pvcC [Rhizobium sp. KVB221]|uniref:Pyoverdin chromophore biosynthetic protein pvcC n=1 Tax=Rhizobium setariae TaxID=2801340 RepID=A0A936YVN8_9HYPH|nr:4-hydroxyphenylacetate 3-hydroxylase N-terminal domain-containing protein [Rhizobium setariae]MBL0374247.1 Pyoverdin chromophore biosynthetic protein pvcC [Rhizobium setariae]